MLFSNCMGPGGHGTTMPTVVSMQSRVHVQPCTHETMPHSGMVPCGSMEPLATWIQVAMDMRGKLMDNGHGSMVSCADPGPCRPGLYR